jgi:hypothetical protein
MTEPCRPSDQLDESGKDETTKYGRKYDVGRLINVVLV